MTLPTRDELLIAYETQLRGLRADERLPRGVTVERDGPLVRFLGFADRGYILYRDLGGLEGPALDDLIERQVRVFAERGERFEWKYHGHDLPTDLPDRLRAAGFVPEDEETVMAARAADITREPRLPDGVSLREVTSHADLVRIAALGRTVFGDHGQEGWLADMLESERATDPDSLTIVVAEASETVVCAAWIRFARGTEFATLWGGTTLPQWRRRGIYRAIVAYRANLAAARSLRYLQVDASDNSRPILERLAFVPVTTTTPYIWQPSIGS